jgi:AcrR family transcriptional regulator
VELLREDDEAPARQRLSAEGRRSAIIDAARVLFARNGFRGTGTSDIAAAAGCSEPMIYKHFESSRRSSWRARRCKRYMRERFAGRRPARASVRRLSALRPRARGRREGGRAVAAALPGGDALGRAEIRAGLAAWWRNGRRTCARQSGRANGRIRGDVDVASVAMLFFGLARAAGFMSAIEGEGAGSPRGTSTRSSSFSHRSGDWMNANRLSEPTPSGGRRAFFALFMIVLDNTVVNVALPSIQRSLKPRRRTSSGRSTPISSRSPR